ncbi:MAG: radical SAM protein [Myxococcota bacterium]|nr:radical SAM protein [Myxococcota bacterium]
MTERSRRATAPANTSGSTQLRQQILPLVQLGLRRATGRKSPFQVTLSLTNRCNFRCEYCDIPLQRRDEMSTQEWKDAIDELVAGGLGRVSLIGGEPLLRKDVGEIIRHLKSRGVHCAMNTNGWLVPERIEDVALLDVVCITLDGPPDVHDAQRHRGSYAKVIAALELLKDRRVPVVTMTVLTPLGAGHVEHVLDVAKQYGHKAFFQLEHDASCDVYSPIAPKMADTRIADIARDLLARKRAGAPVGNSDTVLRSQIRDGRRLGGDCSTCFAGRYFAYILSDGTIAPCLLTQWQQERGNGRTKGFVRAFEEMRPPEGPGCACVPIHEVNSILAFDVGVLFDALEIALSSTRARLRTARAVT